MSESREQVHDPRPGRPGPLWLTGPRLERARAHAQRDVWRAIAREDLDARHDAEARQQELADS